MLKPALIALTMMGCDCDEQLCVPLAEPVQQFSTIGECEAAIPTALDAATGHLHPLLKAECVRQDDAQDALVADASTAAPDEVGHSGRAAAGDGVLGQGFAYAGRTGEYIVYRTADGMVAVRDGLGWAIDRVQGGAVRALAALVR